MKRILFVAGISPFKRGGGSQSTQSYLDATIELFGEDNVDVMIDDTIAIPTEYEKLSFIRIPERSGGQKVSEFAYGYLSRFTNPLIKHMNQNADKYDLCIINGGLAAGKAVLKIKQLGVKTAVIHHNYEVEYHRDNKTVESLHGFYVGGVKNAEKSAYVNSDVNMFLTKQDMQLFEGHYGDTKAVNSVVGCFDLKDSEKVEIGKGEKEYDIAISGTLASYQTTVGVQDFDMRYCDVALNLIPNLKVLLTGRSPSQEIEDIADKKSDVYTIVPNPENILEVVQKASIYICPTCIGGGLKLRAMDGLKSGIPVLAHKVSARGYDYFWDKPYFAIYDDEESFSRGLKEILEYISNTQDVDSQINSDYYSYFGYSAGVIRYRNALMSVCNNL